LPQDVRHALVARRQQSNAIGYVTAMHLFYGLIQLPFWGYIAITLASVQLTLLGITLYLHRDQAHGGLQLHPALRHFFRFWLWFSSGTVTRQWVAVHRRHHVFADRPGDPHSPVIFGLRRVLEQGYELYAAAAADPKTLANFGRGTPTDWLERNLYARFSAAGIVLFVVIQSVLFGVPAITMLGVQLIAQPLLAAGVINGLGHRLGYRSFELPTAATNLLPWGLLIAGEELHNNHHAFPSSPRFAVQPWELDMGWVVICGLRALGLARVTHLAPRPRIAHERALMDVNTVRALFTHRLHVLRDYRRHVIKPVVRELIGTGRASALSRKISHLLVRHPTLLDESAHHRLNELLERYAVLRTVVEFRDRLQQLWEQCYGAHEESLTQWRALREQAASSPVRALREFATRLPKYVTSIRGAPRFE
jgi:stearoyl-CoA desaturase (Delta-9 desaturase)